MTQLNLSARAYHRMRSVKLARTIADLAEALHLRSSKINDGMRIKYADEAPSIVMSLFDSGYCLLKIAQKVL